MRLKIHSDDSFALYAGDQVILSHSPQSPMLYVGRGEENIESYRGNFKIEDYLVERRPLQLTEIREQGQGYLLGFEDILHVQVEICPERAVLAMVSLRPDINRLWLRVAALPDERCFGCGEQMSYLNLRGRHYPLWTSEPGVGRDKSTYVTWRSDVENKAGGDYYHTNYPQPTYVSSRSYYLHADCTAYADFDFRHRDFHELQFWAVPKEIVIESAPDLKQVLGKLTNLLGRQPQLPDWIYNGAVLGLQGGTRRSFHLADRILRGGAAVSGIWCQDWAGVRVTSFGDRLQWDWKWNEERYPGLPEKIGAYKEKGIRFLAYNNCYLVEGGQLYREAAEKGYFATRDDGEIYLVDFGEFDCGVIDLTNPAAYEWYKQCIIRYLIELGADGWMADFGEYLPTDLKLHSGEDPMLAHNRWPALWAKCNHDAVAEAGRWGDIVYFMRAGGTGSPRYCPLLWAGDQSVDFTRHDGLPTTIVAALSAGMSGCGITHSDIGGYTSLFDNTRTRQVFLRWCEMAVFTPVMRTHEGNRPATNYQFYDDADAVERFAEMTNIHVALKPYLKAVVAAYAATGLPAQRALFLHYPEDEASWEVELQYLLGEDLLVAPVYGEDVESWQLYLPPDRWAFLWTGEEYQGGTVEVKAPIGYAPVFYRKDSPFADLFADITGRFGWNR